jgi:hypothetical protein
MRIIESRTRGHIQLYGTAYGLAWKQISSRQKREQPDLALWLHAFIRRQINDGANDPSFISSEALKALDERSEPETPKPQEN